MIFVILRVYLVVGDLKLPVVYILEKCRNDEENPM